MKKITKHDKKQASALTQHCIEAHYVDELLEIPDEVKIESVQWEIGEMHKKNQIKVPNKLKLLGVNYMRQLHATQHLEGTFEDCSRDEIRRRMQMICKETGHNPKRFRVRYAKIAVEGAEATFKRVQKELRPTQDLRQKVKVLGLSTHTGNINKLLRAVSAKKFTCQIDYVTTRTVVCSKM